MSRKSSSDSENGFGDVIGVALLAAALLLLVAQFSFDRYDLSSVRMPPNKPVHNWIGPSGAWIAHSSFFIFGVAAYALPLLLAVFGVAYLFNILGYLRQRSGWSVLWAVVAVLSLTGLLHMTDGTALAGQWREKITAPFIGGWLGYFPYEYGFWMLGGVGATIVYAALYLISLLFLTNFRLGEWLRGCFGDELKTEGMTPDEIALERRAHGD
ncbi:MAG: DNA translocase FtsK 4TM domain-containing protein, partial [Verrucomicrobiota bacterium]